MMALKWGLRFTGGAGYISIPEVLKGANTFNIELDVLPRVIGSNFLQVLASGDGNPPTRNAFYFFGGSRSHSTFVIGGSLRSLDSPTGVYSAGTLYKIVIDYNGSSLRLIVNGVTRVTVACSGVVGGNFGIREIGANSPEYASNRAPIDLYRLKFTVNGALVRDYNPDLSGGAGNVLTDGASGQNGVQVGDWPTNNSEWFQYEAGGGGAIITGGGVSTFAINDIGGGNVLRRGGSVDSFSVNSTGNGRVTFAGGSADNFSFTGAGGGNVLRRGGSADTFSFTVVGGGEVINGAVTVTGGAAITFSVGAVGGGTVLRCGGSADTFTLVAAGNGRTVRIGGGVDTFAVNTLGSGNTIRGAGGSSGFTVNADGAGYTVRAGGSSIEFTVFASGGGDSLGQGYKPVIKSPVLSLQTSSKSGTLPVIESISTNPVTVQRLLRGAVVSAGKTKRLPYNLSVKRTVRGAVCTL